MSARTMTIAQIMGLGEDVRIQNPSVLRTKGRGAKWYIRPWIEKVTVDGIKPVQERIYLGSCDEMNKRQAIVKKNEVMATINRRQYVIQAQVNFGEFLDHYLKEFVRRSDNLSASTQDKYEIHIKKYIRPELGALPMAQVTTKRIDALLAGMRSRDGRPLSYATKLDTRNILSGIFARAEAWGLWKDRNPAIHATVGKARAVREHQKLTTEQTQALLAALPEDVRLIVLTALYCTLRISEVLGLQWKHIDFDHGVLAVSQRYYRGDLDVVKTRRAKREVTLPSELFAELKLRSSDSDVFVFAVRTCRGQCRDDRGILQHFVRPAAKALGIYYKGFGFHSFRREAITNLQAWLNPLEVARMAGHSKVDMTGHYTLADRVRQKQAQAEFAKQIAAGRAN